MTGSSQNPGLSVTSVFRPSDSEITALTGLRGLAALYVMFYHFFAHAEAVPPLMTVFLKHGYLSVDLFFLLSGYVVTISNPRVVASGYADIRQFAIFILKRMARLYPLYLCVVGYALYRAWSITPPGTWFQLAVTNLTLIQSWGLAPGVGGPTWSLSLEWGAYFLFPLLAMLFVRSGPTVYGVAIALSVISLLACVGLPKPYALRAISGPLDLVQYYSPFPILRCLASFSLGMSLVRLTQIDVVRRLFKVPHLDMALLVISLLILFIPGSDVAFVLIGYLLIASLVVNQTSLASRLLSLWPVWWIGVISYSIYLLHGFLVNNAAKITLIMSNTHSGWLYIYTVGLLSVCVLIVSSVTYLIIEKPGRDRLLRLISRLTN